jgi:hypothetical protein
MCGSFHFVPCILAFLGALVYFEMSGFSSSNKVKKERKMFLLSIFFGYMAQEKW